MRNQFSAASSAARGREAEQAASVVSRVRGRRLNLVGEPDQSGRAES
jgi:hypothetical protein